MVELTGLLKSVSDGKTALEELNKLNEKFQKEQQQKMMASIQPAPTADPRTKIQMDIDCLNRQQADLAIQVNNLHRMYATLQKKSAPWSERLVRERQHRVQYQEQETDWYHQSQMIRTLASEVIAKADSPAMHLENHEMSWTEVLPASSAGVHVMVHSVVNTEEESKALLECEYSIPYFHDLCITTTELDPGRLCQEFSCVQKIQSATVRKISGDTTTLASLLGIFAREVARHEIVLNLDFQQLLNASDWHAYIDSLCGSEKRVEQIFTLFQSTGNVGLFYARDLRKSQDPFEFTFEDFPEAEKEFQAMEVPFNDAVFSFPEWNCFWCRTEILRPLIGDRWTQPPREETNEDRENREQKERREDQKVYDILLKKRQGLLARSIGYLCDLKQYRQCVTAPGSTYFYGTVQNEVRNQFAWENLESIGLEYFEKICFSVRDTLLTSCGQSKYCAREDLLKLYHSLQNKGVFLYIFNDLGEDAEKILRDCGYDGWDCLTNRVDQVPKRNTCVICAHRIGEGKRTNELVILSPERLLSLTDAYQLNAALKTSDPNRAVLISGGLYNRADTLSDSQSLINKCRNYAAALLFKGVMEAAEDQIPKKTAVLTIGEEGIYLKKLWEMATGREAYHLPLTEDLLHQASIQDQETFMGIVDRPFEGTLEEFLEERFDLTVKEPYKHIRVKIPEQRKNWKKILKPVSSDIIKRMQKKRIFCEQAVKVVPFSKQYALLSLHPSARARYELAEMLNASVVAADFYTLQKTQWKDDEEKEYVQPFPFCVDILKTNSSKSDDQETSEEDNKNGLVQMQKIDEAGTHMTGAQRDLLRIINKLRDCRLESIADYHALGQALMQVHVL